MAKNFAWSYTRYDDFNSCRLSFSLKHITKDPRFKFVKNAAMERGERIHKLAEQHTKGEVTGMPNELKNFEKEFKLLRKVGALAEADWTVRKDWSLTHTMDWDGAWCRSKTDFHWFDDFAKILYIGDHKTGRKYPHHVDQAHLYSAIGLELFPEAKHVVTEFWYLDQEGDDAVTQVEFKASKKKEMLKLWETRARKMEVNQIWEPTENGKCRFCPLYQTSECSATG